MKKQIPQLDNLKKQSKPSVDFKKVLWAELSDTYDHQYPSMIFCIRHRFAVPVVVLCLFALTGVGSYAYGSPAVTEDHVLFPIKDSMELVQEWASRSPEAMAAFRTRMTERRIEEGEFLIQRSEVSLSNIERIDHSFEQAVLSIEAASEDSQAREQMLMRLETHRARYEFLLMQSIEIETDTTTPEELRNVLLDFRVHIGESGLTEEEKSSLLNRYERQQESLTR